MNSYTKLGIAAMLPVIVSTIFYYLNQNTKFAKLSYKSKQCIMGITFGLLAIVGNEWSIPIDGALVNCRDSAVITAGLFFGGPAGIIAGLIGGIERWVSVAWGAGAYTKVACCISTILAGFISAMLRKFMYEHHTPRWTISAAIAAVIEVFHMNMVFLTNMDTPFRAMKVIQACTGPMVLANSLSVMFTALLIYYLNFRQGLIVIEKNKPARISQTVQAWMICAFVAAFIATSVFLYNLQQQSANIQGEKLLTMALDETESDIRDTSNANLLSVAERLIDKIELSPDTDLNTQARSLGVAEINIVDQNGIITDSTNEKFIGYDMKRGSQSSEFMCLLDDEIYYVQDYGPISINPHISRKYAGMRYGSGFIQVGFDAYQFQVNIAQEIIDITKNRHVGQTGKIIILDEKYNVISAPEGSSLLTIREQAEYLNLTVPNKTYRVGINNTKYWIRYREVEGYYVTSILPADEVMQMRNMSLYINSFMEIIIFAILFGLIYFLLNHVVVDKIKIINSSLNRITNGNLNEVVDVRSTREFSSLSDDINSTVNTLKEYIDEASKRIDQELQVAQEIQRSALPSVFPAFPKRKDVDIYASMVPAKEVGGDFYDFYMTKNDTLNFLVADVSGKGIPAAMFMMRAKTELKSLTEAELNLSDIFTRGNNNLCEGNDAAMFVTVWQGSINLSTGLVQYVNAGHNPPLVRHADGKFEFLKTRPGFVLAGMDGIRYKTQQLQLSPGDIIFLYTDGVTEATNADEELYGNDRLENILNKAEFNNMQELCQCVKDDIDAFVGDAPQFDDITMVAFQMIGTPPNPSIHFDEAKIEDIRAITDFVEEEMDRLGCPMKYIIQINIAMDEILSNIIRYGYAKQTGPITVEVIHHEDPRCVYIRFADEGIPYNPITAIDPDITLSAEERDIGGLGIFMVKQTMDDIKYKYENGQNILTIQKLY